MVKDMCAAFLDAEVLPVIERIDKLEPGLMPSLIVKAGEQVCWVRLFPRNMVVWEKTLSRLPWSTKDWVAAIPFR